MRNLSRKQARLIAIPFIILAACWILKTATYARDWSGDTLGITMSVLAAVLFLIAAAILVCRN